MGRLSVIPDLEKKIGKPIKQYLTEAINQGKKPPDIASDLDISKSLAYEAIKQAGLKDLMKSIHKKGGAVQGELENQLKIYFAEKRRANLSAVTLKKDEETWRLWFWWLNYTGKPADLNSLSLENLREFFTYITTQTNRYGHTFKKPVGPQTERNYRKRMAAFIHWGQKMGLFPPEPHADPFTKMMKIKISKKLPEDMPDEILIKAVNSFGIDFLGIRDRTLFEWFLETGMRIGGVRSVEISDFDWESGRGRVVEKGNKERTIVLSDKLKAQVKKYLEVRKPIAKSNALWIAETGEPLKESGIRGVFYELQAKLKDEIAEKAPGQRFHPHLLRHIWAKHLALSEVPGFAMMVMGGWEDLKLVQHYAAAYNQEKAWGYINKASPLSKIG